MKNDMPKDEKDEARLLQEAQDASLDEPLRIDFIDNVLEVLGGKEADDGRGEIL